jgi:hypothetical protein
VLILGLARREAAREMSFWRDKHLAWAEYLEAGGTERPQVSAEQHRVYAADYERWIEALEARRA